MSRVRKFAQKLKAKSIRFERRHKPIIIFGLRRGGTTMVADAIAASPGVWFSNEPFAVLPAHPGYELKSRMLPSAPHSHFFELEGDAEERFRIYSDALLTASLPQLGTCRRTKFPLSADRVCLKVLNAPWMIGWFEREVDAHILPFLRHPGGQAISTIRQGWSFPIRAYLDRIDALEEHFSLQQKETLKAAWISEDKWRIAVADYVVSSKIIRERYGNRLVKYEDVVADPRSFVETYLVGEFGLQDSEAMVASMLSPSNSSRMSLKDARDAISNRNVDAILNSWKTKVTQEMKQSGQEILDAFEVQEYSFFDDNTGSGARNS